LIVGLVAWDLLQLSFWLEQEWVQWQL
jgi:hypothetical protein